MAKDKLLTAEEFFLQNNGQHQSASKMMIEFAKMHVKACKEDIVNKGKILRQPTGEGESSEIYSAIEFEGDLGYEDYIPVSYTIDKQSIMNAYPEENIK